MPHYVLCPLQLKKHLKRILRPPHKEAHDVGKHVGLNIAGEEISLEGGTASGKLFILRV